MDGIWLLTITAFSIGFLHTALGPDHYLPFIVMSKARQWSIFKTIRITILAGLGHVLSSILVGIIGIAAGIAIAEIELFEGFRGNLAALAFIAFGAIYFIWGIYKAIKNKPHKHLHFHEDGNAHEHNHNHIDQHSHVHKSITPWILFTIFFLGPCEPLVPILMYPAASGSVWGTIIVTTAFSLATIGTMTIIVVLATYGIKMFKTDKLERYMHAIAGATIMLAGMAIQFLGL